LLWLLLGAAQSTTAANLQFPILSCGQAVETGATAGKKWLGGKHVGELNVSGIHFEGI
jgi:hypothetical protein